ncbi:MAG: hypothetical protein JXR58_03385 [Bacteroidales bacterium]|nr:hypothetical protein [Bacteroidales bacterium]
MKINSVIIVICLLLYGFLAKSQSSANYTFTTAVDASLTDMSSGTTQLVAPNTDGLNTGVFAGTYPIGFTFYFMSMPYEEFVVTEDGVMRLGSSLSPINRTPEITVNEPRLLPFSSDMGTGFNGQVHYKITGAAPNRVCIVEWQNLHISYPNSMPVTGNSTFQIRLYEATGVIEYVYGYMFITRANPYGNCTTASNQDFGAIGFCNTNADNGLLYKSTSYSSSAVGTTLPVELISTSLIECVGTNNIEASGLSSSTNGARRIYVFTPPSAPSAPTNLTYSGITQSSVTLHWLDNATNETHYHIYRSDDGGANFELAMILPANSITSGPISGLPDKTYYWKIYAVNEGRRSNALEGNCTTQPAGTIHSTVTGGLWSQTATWEEGVLPGVNDDVFIRDGATVTIDINTAVCNNLTVGEGSSGHLEFIGGGSDAILTCDGDVVVSANATFDVNPTVTGGSRSLIIGQRFYSNSNLTVNGTFDMDMGGLNFANVEFRGTVDGTISGTGPTCDFYSITVNKGTDNEKCIEAVRNITINAPSVAANRLIISNGTFKLSDGSNLTPWFGNQTICPSTGRIWINHASGSLECVGAGTLTGAGNVIIDGKLQVTAGTFGYGSGANTCTVNGTLEVDGDDGIVNINGRLYFAPSGYCNIFAGNVNIDPQAGANLAAGRVVEFPSLSTVLFTGGTMTIVDPNANSSSSEFYIQSNEQNKVFSGATIRFGNGISSITGNANGFTIAVPGQYLLNIGSIVVNNPAGSNRVVRMTNTSGGAATTPSTFNKLEIIAGTFNLNGRAIRIIGSDGLINNGTFLATTANSRLIFGGSILQTYSGAGTLNTSNLTTQINNSSGVTLNSPLSTLSLVLTSGKLNTTSVNLISVTGTTTGNISGNSASSYVNGPLARNITNGAATWVFPVGKSGYTFFEIINPATAGTVMVQAEAFDADCGGTIINPPGYELNTGRYWQAQAIGGAAFTSGTFRVNEVNPTTNMIITQSAVIDGTYTSVHASQAGSSITSAAATPGLGYFCSAAPGFLEGIYYVGTGQPFTSLTENTANGFFKAVNSSGLKGDVTLIVTSNITENGSQVLNQWAEINGTGHTIRIVPQNAVLKTIVGNVGTDFGMIRFSGADRVCIDGSFAGSGKYLLFRNTHASYPVFGFINESTNDTLMNIVIESSNTNTNASRRGAIIFGTSSSGTTGNSFNVIANCDIRNRSDAAGIPRTLVFSQGTNGRLNKNNIVSNNNIFNFNYEGLLLNSTGTGGDWVIEGNHFYQTANRNVAQIAIRILTGTNQQITGNYIGGGEINCGGGAWTNTGNVAVKGISISTSAGDPASVQGNVINNFNLTGGSGSFIGIEITGGPCNIGTITGNEIGDVTNTNNITIAGNSVNSGIKSNSTSSVSIWNNTICNITCSSTGTTNTLTGIWQSGTGSGNISNNTVYNLSSASTKTNIDAMALQGIYHSGASIGSSYITNNTIYNLSLLNAGSVQTNVAGISLTAVTNPIVNRNLIWSLSNSSTRVTLTSPPTASGISIYRPAAGSTAEIRNNMVSLGNGLTTNTEFNGIWLQSGTNAYAAVCTYNSILVSGTVGAGSLNSFAFLRGDNSSVTHGIDLVIKNNIFANSRAGGTGGHYSVGNQGTTPSTNWNAGTSNNNLYIGSGTDKIALWNSTSCNSTAYKTNTGGDTQSWIAISTSGVSDYMNINVGNLFVDATNGDLHIKTNQSEAWFVNGKGIQHTLNNDIDGEARSTAIVTGSTDLGADEFVPISLPIDAGQTGAIADGGTTTYTFADRVIAEVTWSGINLPTSLSLKYYTQKFPDLTDGMGVPYPNLIGSEYTNCVWDITPTGGSIEDYSYDLKLFYDNSLIGTISDMSDLKIGKNPYRYPTASQPQVFDYGVYVGTHDAVNGTYEIEDVVDFSKFILYTGPAIPLPVELLSFTAEPQTSDVLLNWTTSSEINNDYFTLEKSYDGVIFQTITVVDGAGFSNSILNYEYLDENAFSESGLIYYRLKQTDFNAAYAYSDIIVVRRPFVSQTEVILFPNPVSEGEQSYIQAKGFESNKEILVVVLNVLGQEQYSKVVITDYDGSLLEAVDPYNRLSPGTYLIIGTSNDVIFKKKLIIR